MGMSGGRGWAGALAGVGGWMLVVLTARGEAAPAGTTRPEGAARLKTVWAELDRAIDEAIVEAASESGGRVVRIETSDRPADPGGQPPAATRPEAAAAMTLLDFDGPQPPANKAGDGYPSQYRPSGAARLSIDGGDAVRGRSLRFEVTEGLFYAQFNPFGPGGKGFAREYVARPGQWRFNIYNRLSFWIKCPPNAAPLRRTGQENIQFGTYVKRVRDADRRSDETGGNHGYHHLNLAPTGTWTRVVLNMHPHHYRGASGSQDHGNQLHPTGEGQYNYFDTLTRFYITSPWHKAAEPVVYRLDEFEFSRAAEEENDEQVYSIAATHVPAGGGPGGRERLILTWSRNKNDNKLAHEVRYAFEDIHVIGWDKAAAAPGGVVKPLGVQGYNGMLYETAELPLAGRAEIYLAIKPDNAALFSQIKLPILGGRPTTRPEQ